MVYIGKLLGLYILKTFGLDYLFGFVFRSHPKPVAVFATIERSQLTDKIPGRYSENVQTFHEINYTWCT